MGKSKKKDSEPGCLASLFGLLFCACIIALIIDLIKSKISTRTIYNLKVVAIIICILFVVYLIFSVYRRFNKKYSIKQLDDMEGHRFEYACADILRCNGFKNVKVTQGSGDFGVDIIASKNGLKYAIQCKCYSNKLNNKPIQEVIGGMAYYNCSKGAVMTNQYFTEPAKELARVNNIDLWDRDVLISKSGKCKREKINKFAAKTDGDKNLKLDNITDLAQPEVNHQQETVETNTKPEKQNKYAVYSTAVTNIEKNQKIYKDYIIAVAESTVKYFSELNINIVIKKIDVKYETNEIVLEFSLEQYTSVSKVKPHIKSLAKYVGVKYSEFVYPTSTPYTIGIKMPLPEYLKETSTLIYELNKEDEK